MMGIGPALTPLRRTGPTGLEFVVAQAVQARRPNQREAVSLPQGKLAEIRARGQTRPLSTGWLRGLIIEKDRRAQWTPPPISSNAGSKRPWGWPYSAGLRKKSFLLFTVLA
jgi:hypothetical protein